MADVVRLTLYYRDTPMGFVEKIGKEYSYTSYLENEQIVRNTLLFSISGITREYKEYNLWGSKNRKSKTLFPVMVRFLERCRRADIQERANIDPKDSMWEKLVKFSGLKFHPQNGFYLTRTKSSEKERNHYLKVGAIDTVDCQMSDEDWWA
ncbi:MAG: hypothetical protein FWG02_10580 [Holophagaceae bacterium]|nr:hypothetical protein [Holophagaceae bacterium]